MTRQSTNKIVLHFLLPLDEQIKLFGEFLLSDAAMMQVMIARTLRRYQTESKKLGVVTGLEEIPGMLPTPDET